MSQDSVGLRNVARKLRARKRKAEEEQDENQDAKVEETAVKKIKEENPDTEGTQAEKMDTDEKPVEANAEDSGNHKMEVDEEKCEKGENQGTIKTEQVVTIDVENSSPVKNVKVANDEKTGKPARDSPLTSAYKDSSLPPKADVDLINVSKGMNERTYYQKVTKPYAKLDSLLVKRLKQEEIEIKQRQALQQQINWKLKSQIKSESAPLSKSIKQEEVKTEESKPFTDTTPSEETPDLPSHPCYSYLCRSEEGSCYSCLCMQKQSQDEAMLNLAGNNQQNSSDAEMDEEEEEDDEEEEDVDVEGDGKLSPQKTAQVKDEKVDIKKEVEEQDMETSEADQKSIKPEPEAKSVIPKPTGSTVSTEVVTKVTTSGSSAVVQMLAQKSGAKTNQMTQAQMALRQAIDKMSVEELRSKMPPIRTSKEPIKLVKFAKLGQRIPAKKKATLPSCHKFLTPSGKKTLFALEKFELRKLSRKGGKCETKAFN